MFCRRHKGVDTTLGDAGWLGPLSGPEIATSVALAALVLILWCAADLPPL